MKNLAIGSFLALFTILACSGQVVARDAAFVAPGAMSASNSGVSGNAVTVEPKGDVELGDSPINIERRVVLFFANQSGAPVDISDMSVNGDGNVTSSIVSNDCTKENKIQPNSRCSVVVSLMPTSNGPWAAEVMMTHSGAGRIVKAKITGKTSNSTSSGDKDAGLSLSKKEVQPINFGDVTAGRGRAVRSALMINDSPDPITILSIDLIAAENGLSRLESGCSVDVDLKPGESCPVTMEWKPESKGVVSTDLIIRHSGKLGFVVIPIRGMAKDEDGTSSTSTTTAKDNGNSGSGKTPMPSTATELEKAVGQITAVSADELGVGKTKSGSESSSGSSGGSFRLIGTVGSRAVLLKPDGSTTIAGIGEEIRYDDGKIAKLTNVSPKTAELFVDGAKVQLPLGSAEEIVKKATSGGVSSSGSKNKKGSSTKMPNSGGVK